MRTEHKTTRVQNQETDMMKQNKTESHEDKASFILAMKVCNTTIIIV